MAIKWTLTRIKCTKVAPFVLNGLRRDWTYEEEVLKTDIKTGKKAWELAQEDSLKMNESKFYPSNPPIGHVHFEYDVRKTQQ